MARPELFDAEFFPTPPPIIARMLAKIDKDATHFLEPSAGKGAIADAIKKPNEDHYRTYSLATVDCLEADPDLAAILREQGHTVVGSDWLTYDGVCYYDAIVMNPPLSQGDAHLLKAWDFLHAGEIVCLLNEETLLNPYTASRQRLQSLIAAHGEVEYLGACFTTAARPTDVRVTLVSLKKVSADDTLDLWANETTERAVEDGIGADPQWLAIVDTLGNMQHFYDQANVHMFKAFQHLRKAALYMEANHIGNGYRGDYDKVVPLALHNITGARAEFSRLHRKNAWQRVFEKMDFQKWLDKKQTDEFLRDIERESTIPFTKENIKGTLENIFLSRTKLFEMSVANVFDELTSYYKGNTNHGEGWKTNDSYKVNKKLVFPYGCRFDNKYCFDFSLYGGRDMNIYRDLDRILCVLDGQDFTECWTIGRALDNAFHVLGTGVKSPFYNMTESRYFDIRFFKKGTVHLVFKDLKLWQDFNVTAAKGKRWLGMQTQADATTTSL